MASEVNEDFLDLIEPLQGQEPVLTEAGVMACPFCLSDRPLVYEVDARVWAVYCTQCQAVGPHVSSKLEAIARWAKRP